MKIRSLLAVAAAAAAAFVWSSISWMLIPWHQPTMSVFDNEAEIGRRIQEAAPTPGIYTYPGWTDNEEEMMKKHEEGPYVFASVVPAGVGTEMGSMMFAGFLINVLGAVLLVMLQLQHTHRKQRLAAGFLFALALSFVPALMEWNWWHFPVGFTTVAIIEGVVGWTLAAVVAAAILPGQPVATAPTPQS